MVVRYYQCKVCGYACSRYKVVQHMIAEHMRQGMVEDKFMEYEIAKDKQEEAP